MGVIISRIIQIFSNLKTDCPKNEAIEETKKVYSWDLRKELDLSDYMIKDKKNETIIRLPGTINGNQFNIQNSEDCNIYLFDNVAILTIDDCKNCKIFCGPTKGCVFIRNSTDCTLAVICQQFRTRDCRRITTFLSCATQPAIEASVYMKFACLTCNYNDLQNQLNRASLTVFDSNWCNVYDFTQRTGENNYSLLEKTAKLEDFMPYPNEETKNSLKLSYEKQESLIPLTFGTTMRQSDESCLVFIFYNTNNPSQSESEARNVIESIANTHDDVILINTRHFNLSEMSAENLFETKLYNNLVKAGPLIGMEFNGPECISKCQNCIQKLKIDNVYVSQSAAKIHHQLNNFYNFYDMQMS